MAQPLRGWNPPGAGRSGDGAIGPCRQVERTGIKEASADTAPNRPEPTEHRPIEAGSAEFEPTGIGRSRNPTLSPAERPDRFLTPLSALVVLPLFAFFSLSISLDQLGPGLLTDRVILGATLGLALLGVLAGRSCPCSSWPSALSLVGCGLPGASRPDYKTYPLSELSHASLGFRQNRSPTRLSYDGRAWCRSPRRGDGPQSGQCPQCRAVPEPR
ncbi:MAG: Na+/H+ antiporter NhaA [Bifidobacterium asteroides]